MVCSIVKGIPIHRLITIILNLAQAVFVQKGSEAEISPQFFNSILTGPSGWSIVRITNSATNCGTAMERIKIKRQKAFPLVSFLLITIASIMPNR